ncbi:YfcL family protein [Glaciecola sp. XM2]|jgi:hypothetical protein|uniref:YfcL family protein n=1 Tax=Glaciecola sp. XM2 TaxID=1914931 RepID=UPI001BDE0EE5|nr:YfcL family protein [Glaciecola sp. XM2]MBT1450968.1 YfcL family protein [Glaciecola sp. XM2]
MLSDAQHTYLDHKEAFLDQFIDEGSDHALFISSYIHGHFSVVAANMPAGIDALDSFASTFEDALYSTIKTAIADGELASEDAQAVLNMLDKMFSKPATGGNN